MWDTPPWKLDVRIVMSLIQCLEVELCKVCVVVVLQQDRGDPSLEGG